MSPESRYWLRLQLIMAAAGGALWYAGVLLESEFESGVGVGVLVSALALPGGKGERALQRVIDGPDRLIISKPIIHELLGVLARKFAGDAEELARTAVFLAELGDLIEPSTRLDVLADEPDNRILECAVDGEADLVVTGDHGLLALGEFRGVRILSLRDFLETE